MSVLTLTMLIFFQQSADEWKQRTCNRLVRDLREAKVALAILSTNGSILHTTKQNTNRIVISFKITSLSYKMLINNTSIVSVQHQPVLPN